ncbi:hypothetical protein IQ269_23005 [Tychonema sp. LEGE 07199]|uniref:hypothetical protein n=1 Tax=unclassified Tychonema TaxID=2642144 RepID=UPI00188037EA|nr:MULTISPECIES: hypothetical protein [unclassified Tychonema]MBE9123588.1 hypothetical protein [Tychonema sp. LEGE 07199]MBE9135058.1 hypothetical protein [Tychonema sp. LEGE 07196]
MPVSYPDSATPESQSPKAGATKQTPARSDDWESPLFQDGVDVKAAVPGEAEAIDLFLL